MNASINHCTNHSTHSSQSLHLLVIVFCFPRSCYYAPSLSRDVCNSQYIQWVSRLGENPLSNHSAPTFQLEYKPPTTIVTPERISMQDVCTRDSIITNHKQGMKMSTTRFELVGRICCALNLNGNLDPSIAPPCWRWQRS